MRSVSLPLPIDRRLRMAKAVIPAAAAAVPVIKTIHTTETLALALARHQRWLERYANAQSKASP